MELRVSPEQTVLLYLGSTPIHELAGALAGLCLKAWATPLRTGKLLQCPPFRL